MMILIIKLQNFPYTCFFCNNYNIDHSQVPLQKKEWPQILFLWVPHPLKFICQYASYWHMLAPLHSIIDRKEHENTENSLVTAHAPTTDESN